MVRPSCPLPVHPSPSEMLQPPADGSATLIQYPLPAHAHSLDVASEGECGSGHGEAPGLAPWAFCIAHIHVCCMLSCASVSRTMSACIFCSFCSMLRHATAWNAADECACNAAHCTALLLISLSLMMRSPQDAPLHPHEMLLTMLTVLSLLSRASKHLFWHMNMQTPASELAVVHRLLCLT